MLLEAFDASIAACRHVVVVGLDIDDLVAVYRDLEPTQSLANPAKGLYRFSHHRPRL
jgi:hypothetical protein